MRESIISKKTFADLVSIFFASKSGEVLVAWPSRKPGMEIIMEEIDYERKQEIFSHKCS